MMEEIKKTADSSQQQAVSLTIQVIGAGVALTENFLECFC